MRVAIVIAVLGLSTAVSYPLITRQRAIARDTAAVEWLRAIGEAQARFRTSNGAYAATLESLTAPCADGAAALSAALTDRRIVDHGYEISMRPAIGATDGRPDCHGRATTTDFYVAARPIDVDRNSIRALAMTGGSGVLVFVDGVPPTEADMAPGGLAMPLDRMPKIP